MPEKTKPSETKFHSYHSDLSDEQWLRVQPLLGNVGMSDAKEQEVRDDIDAILYILKTKKAWSELPDDLPSAKTAYAQFKKWQRSGIWDKIERVLSNNQDPFKTPEPVRNQSTVFVHEGRLNYQSYGNNYSSRAIDRPVEKVKLKPQKSFLPLKKLIALGVVVIVGIFIFTHHSLGRSINNGTSDTSSTSSSSSSVLSADKPNPCASNALPKLALVSISQRHMWACNGSTVAYSSAVVTGMENYVADTTPLGSYTIYAKQTKLYLNGSDSTGSWHDWVYYWMPFLSNQYGVYGFHDATWRTANEFGNISPSSSNASHGCVEMPLSAAAWLYNWVNVGTTVKIET